MSANQKLRIARVIARLNVGGPATQAILMTDAFRRRGYQTSLLTGEVAPGEASMDYLARELNVQPVKIATMSRKISYARDLQSLWRLVRIFRREKPAILHTHTAKAGTLGRIAAMLTGVPIRVHTFHGHVFHGYFSAPRTRLFVAIERFLARHTDCIVAVSESQKQELVEVYRIAPKKKVVSIPLGFDLRGFLRVGAHEGSLRASIGCPHDSFLVGWIGRVTAIKAPDLFLESAALANSESPSTRFVMVGDGELRGWCEKRILETGLQDIVSLIGWQRDLGCIYSDLDLLLLTSINEGTPLALLEAMASARPVVATDVGGIRDVLIGKARKERGWERFDNGMLVPRDPRVIADAVQYLQLRPELRREMGLAGRQFVSARFSQRRLADELESLYLRLAKEKKVFRENLSLTPAEPVSASRFE
jgi:glycosyltransferase involved in cell wall biosynthesis